jgi:6-phosphogluconolactonase
MEIVVTPTPADAAAETAQWIARRIRTAVRARGVCRLAVSGGSSIVPLFDALVGIDGLPWKQVHVFQVDERIAPDGHVDRNANDLLAHFAAPAGLPKRNVHLMPVTRASLSAAARAYVVALGHEPLDIVHLGMGEDGHTASWPPGDDTTVATEATVAVTGVFNGRQRMTMTPVAVNAARARVALIAGGGKAEPLSRWMLGAPDLPINHLRRSNTTVIADAAAAARLQTSR